MKMNWIISAISALSAVKTLISEVLKA